MIFWFAISQLLYVALAAPHVKEDLCSSVCTVGDQDEVPFQPGKSYIYDYSASSTTQAPDLSGDQSVLRFQGGFSITAKTPCELMLVLEQGVIIGRTQRSIVPNRIPLRFSYHHGSVEHICPDEKDEEWVLNIKKAILSHFETRGFFLSSPVDQMVEEDDISGRCPAAYTVEESKGQKTITKQKDLSKCGNRDGGKSFVQGKPFIPEALETLKSIPLTESSQSCTHSIQDNQFKVIRCSEKHGINPFFLAKDQGHKLIQATVQTELKLRKVKDSTGDKDFPQTGLRGNESLFFNHDAYLNVGGKTPIAQTENLMKLACEKLMNGDIETVPGIFANFVHLLKFANYAELKNLMISSRSSYICRDVSKTSTMFLNALPSVDTPASMALILDLLDDSSKSSTISPFWMTSLAFISNPTIEMVGSLNKIISNDGLNASQLLPVAAMTYTACVNNLDVNCRTRQEVRMVNSAIRKRLRKTKDITNSIQEDQVIAALKAAGNLGYLNEETTEIIKDYIEDPNTPLSIQIAAVDSLRRVPCDYENIEILLHKTLSTTSNNAALRIFAYITAMKCPDEKTIDEAIKALEQDDSNQVSYFIWSHLHNIEKSSSPFRKNLKKMITDKLKFSQAEERINNDIRKFSNNFDLTMKFFKDVGLELGGDLVFSQHSYVPAHISANTTINLFGKSINLLEIGAGFHGFEKVLEKVFGPDGYFSNKTTTDIWNDSQALIEKSDKTFQKYLEKLIRRTRGISDKTQEDFHSEVNKQAQGPEEMYTKTPTADIYVRIFGHEIAWIPVHMTKGNANEMASSFFNQLSKINTDISPYNVKFLDTHLSVPTAMGFPLKFVLNGTATIDLKMTSKPDGRDRNTLDFRPGFAIEIQGHMLMDAYMLRTGMKTIGRMFSSTGMQAKFSLTNNKIDLNVDLPQQKQTIFGLHSNTFLTHDNPEDFFMEEIAVLPHDKGTSSKSSSCISTLEKPLGLKMCYEVSRTRDNIVDSYPLVYPFDISANIEKTDPSMRGYHILAYQEMGERYALGVLFDTPGSRTNRKIKMDTSFSFDREIEVIFSLDNPFHNVELAASGINSNDLKKLDGKIVWGKDTYRATARADVVTKAAHTSITPFIEIFNGQKTLRVLEGKILKSTENLDVDLTSPVLDIKAKGKVELISSRGKGEETFKIKDVEVTRGAVSYSGTGMIRQTRAGGAAVDLDLRYDHGTPQTVKITGFLENEGNNDGLYYKAQVDFANTEAPQYNARAKFNILNKFSNKGATFANNVHLWYGRHADMERENHFAVDQRYIAEFNDGINFVNSINVLADPYNIDDTSEVMFMWTANTKQFKIKNTASGHEYLAELAFRKKTTNLLSYTIDGKIGLPKQSIVYSEKMTEVKPGHYENEGTLQLTPGSKYDFKCSYHQGKNGNSNYYNAASILSRDRQDLFRFTSKNDFEHSKFNSQSLMNIMNVKVVDYSVKWQRISDTHDFEIKGSVYDEEASLNLDGSYSEFNQRFNYMFNLKRFNSKLFGTTEAKTTASGGDLTSNLNCEHQQTSYFQGALFLKSTPELTNAKIKIKIPVENVNFEIDSKLDSELVGDHSLHAEVDLPNRDHYSFDAASNLKFSRKNIYMKLVTPKSRLFSLSWNGMVARWDPQNGIIEVLTDLSWETPRYGSIKLEGTVKQKPQPKGFKAESTLSISGSRISTGDITFNLEKKDNDFTGSLVGKDGSRSFSVGTQGNLDFKSKVFQVLGNFDIRVPKTPWEKIHVSINSKVLPEQKFKMSNNIKIQYTIDKSIEIEQNLEFESKDGTNVQGFLKVTTPYADYRYQKLTFEKVFEKSSLRNQNKLTYEYGSKKAIGVTANYQFGSDSINMEMMLQTPIQPYDKAGFILDHDTRHRGEVYSTDFQLFLPFSLESRLTNVIDLSTKSKSIDTKISFNGDALVGVVASLESQSKDRYKASFQLDSEGKKVLFVTGIITYKAYDDFRGDLALEAPTMDKMRNAAVQFSATKKGQQTDMNILGSVANAPIFKATSTYGKKAGKFELSGAASIEDNEAFDLKKSQLKLTFVMDELSAPKLTSGKIVLTSTDKEELMAEILRTISSDLDASQLRLCSDKDCVQFGFETRHKKQVDLNHDLKLSVKFEDPKSPSLHAIHYKMNKQNDDLEHSLIFTESLPNDEQSLGYEVLIKEDTMKFTLVLPTRSVELKGFIEEGQKEGSRKMGIEFSVDKQNKPTHKLDVFLELTKVAYSREGHVFKIKAVASHPKFKKKTMSAEGTVTLHGHETLLAIDLDVDLFNDDSNKFLFGYNMTRHHLDTSGLHNNYTISASMNNKYLGIYTVGHVEEKDNQPKSMGLLFTYGGKKLEPKFIYVDCKTDLSVETGKFNLLFQNNEKSLELTNLYHIGKESEPTFLRSTLSGFDDSPGIATDITFERQKTTEGRPYYQVAFDAYDIGNPSNKFCAFAGMPDPRTFEIIATQGPNSQLLADIYVGLNTTRLLHTRLAWRSHNIKKSLNAAQNRLSSVSDNLSDSVQTTLYTAHSDISHQWNKIKLNSKYIKALTSSYGRHFSDISDSFNEIDSLKYIPVASDLIDQSTIDEMGATVKSLFTQVKQSLYDATTNIGQSLPTVPGVVQTIHQQVTDTLGQSVSSIQDFHNNLDHFALHNDWYNSYAKKANGVLEQIWRHFIDISTNDSPEDWYNIFQTANNRRPISIEQIEQKVQKVMDMIISKIDISSNPFVNMYRDQLKKLYRIGQDEFLNFARFIRNGFGRSTVYQPSWTELQYEIPLPWPVNDLYDFPTFHSWSSKTKSTNITIEDNFNALRHVLKSTRFIPPFESNAIVSSGGYIMTFDGDFIHYPLNCAYLLAQDFASKKFSLFAHFYNNGMKFTLHSGNNHVEIDPKALLVKINHRHVATITPPGYTINKDGKNLHFSADNIGVKVDCTETDLGDTSCKVTLSGFHHGKSRGILGTNDNEHHNDMMGTSGRLTDKISLFLESWKTDSKCFHYPISARPITVMQKDQCISYFKNEDSRLKSCFKFVNPEPYYKACIQSKSPMTLSKIYSEACKLESISVNA